MGLKRARNRLIILCSSINDLTAWPYWKCLQMRRIRGVTDMALLAFNSKGGSFEARIEDDKFTMKNYVDVKKYQQDMLERFVQQWHDPGRTYFVYGGHGMGDYIDLEQGKASLQMFELAAIFGRRQFEAVVFDACFMANLDCAYHLRHNTKFIGACEGYMWEPDHITSRHILNERSAALMSNGSDPRHVLEQIQSSYCRQSPFADFSVIKTSGIEDLHHFVEQYVIPRVYARSALYTDEQLQRLAIMGDTKLKRCEAMYNWSAATAGGEGARSRKYDELDLLSPHSPAGASERRLACPQAQSLDLVRRVQLEHSLYPYAGDDKHLVDLKSYLIDMAREEALDASLGGSLPSFLVGSDAAGSVGGSYTARARKVLASRALNVQRHGSLPAPIHLPAPGEAAEGIAKRMSTTSPILCGTGLDGLQLFDRVVLRQRGSRAKALYAARLGGLSLSLHDFSIHSKPLHPWKLPMEKRRLFEAKAREFESKGCMPEVSMPPPPEVARVLKPLLRIKRIKKSESSSRSSKKEPESKSEASSPAGQVMGEKQKRVVTLSETSSTTSSHSSTMRMQTSVSGGDISTNSYGASLVFTNQSAL